MTKKIVPLARETALDCTELGALKVLAYYQKGISLYLPMEKYFVFIDWIFNKINGRDNIHGEQIVCEKHESIPTKGGRVIRMLT